MPARMPRLAIDMDEVIADANAMQAKWLMETYGYDWSANEIAGASLETLASIEHNRAWEEKLHHGEIFSTFDVMPGSQDALAELSEQFEIFITTAAMEYPASCAPKFSWLQRNFSFIPSMNIVFCGDKSIIAADFLVDDNSRHFAHFKGQGVLFSAPHNLDVDWHFRVSSWPDAKARLLSWRDQRS